jgi:hypothetical protein
MSKSSRRRSLRRTSPGLIFEATRIRRNRYLKLPRPSGRGEQIKLDPRGLSPCKWSDNEKQEKRKVQVLHHR